MNADKRRIKTAVRTAAPTKEFNRETKWSDGMKTVMRADDKVMAGFSLSWLGSMALLLAVVIAASAAGGCAGMAARQHALVPTMQAAWNAGIGQEAIAGGA